MPENDCQWFATLAALMGVLSTVASVWTQDGSLTGAGVGIGLYLAAMWTWLRDPASLVTLPPA